MLGFKAVVCPRCGKLIVANEDGTPAPHVNKEGKACVEKK